MKRILAALILLVLSVGTAVRPAAAQSNVTYYTVQPGDNLFRIGLKFNIRADVLAQVNGIVNPNLVYVGQKLIIPVSPAVLTLTAVVPTLAPTQAATAASTEGAPSEPVSETLVPSDTPSVTDTPEAATVVPTTPAPVAAPTTYTVQVGDTLYRISVRFNTTTYILAQLNGLPNPNLIYVGQVLRLPIAAPAALPPAPAVTNTPLATIVAPAVSIQV
ncbi:MAG TPA: LysM peptidoglycan-binding domain-containing protein, partial [Aggregatilineales bacterium]|nr:LysM peptidoglycan-binding domain-containing protein [Aggregatilineales bacterium]